MIAYWFAKNANTSCFSRTMTLDEVIERGYNIIGKVFWFYRAGKRREAITVAADATSIKFQETGNVCMSEE